MADPVAPPREYQASEVLSSMGKVETPGVLDKIGDADKKRRVEFGQRRADQLRGGTPPREGRGVFDENLRKSKEKNAAIFDHKKAGDLENIFGNSSKTPSGEFAESRTEAGKVIAQHSDFLKYSDIKTQIDTAVATGGTKTDALTAYGITEADYNTLKANSIDAIINSPYVQDTFGDMLNTFPKDATGEEARRIFMEQTLLSKPALAEKIGQKMAQIAEKAKNLPKVTRDEQTEVAEQKISKAEIQRTRALDAIIGLAGPNVLLNNPDGTPLDPTVAVDKSEIDKRNNELKNELTKAMRFGHPDGTDLSLKRLETILLKYNPNAEAVKNYPGDEIRQKLTAAEKAMNEAKAATTPDADAIKKLEDEYNELNNEHGAAVNAYVKLDSSQVQEAQIVVKQIDMLTKTTKDSKGNYLGAVAKDLKLIAESDDEIKQANTEKAQYKAEAGDRKAQTRAERLLKEQELIVEMNNMMAESITELMNEQYDTMSKADLARIEKDGSEVAKVLAEKMRTNWVVEDEKGRKLDKRANREQIGKDIRRLAWHGEEGVKQLLMRDLGMNTGVDTDGNPLWQSPDAVDNLTQEEKDKLNSAYDKFGSAYTKKLMVDFFMAKGFRDNTVNVGGFEIARGNLALKSTEWKMLADKFGGMNELKKMFGEAEAASPDKIMKALQENGMTADSAKMKWIIAILAALGIVIGTGGAAAAIGGVASVVGAGNLAAGAGVAGAGAAVYGADIN